MRARWLRCRKLRLGPGVAVVQFRQVLNHEARPAQSADQFLPAMHELQRPFSMFKVTRNGGSGPCRSNCVTA